MPSKHLNEKEIFYDIKERKIIREKPFRIKVEKNYVILLLISVMALAINLTAAIPLSFKEIFAFLSYAATIPAVMAAGIPFRRSVFGTITLFTFLMIFPLNPARIETGSSPSASRMIDAA